MATNLVRVGKMLTRFGVDADQFALLVHNKQRLATRDTGLGLGFSSSKPSVHALRNSLLVNLVIGACLALILLLPAGIGFATYFATYLLLLFMTMLTGYSTLMLDPKDRNQFFTRGVSAATINAARLYVVGYYLLLNAGALGVVGIVASMWAQSMLTALAFVVSLALAAVFALVLALLVYLLVLRFFDGERLKNLLNFMQIALMVGMYLASQLLPRVNFVTAGSAKFFNGWSLLVPPLWFAGLPTVASGAVNTAGLAAIALSVIGVALMVFIYMKNAQNFEQYLAKLDTANGSVRHVGWYFRLLQRVFANANQVQGYFLLAWQHLRQEREFKLRVYPNFAYFVIVIGMMIFNLARDGSDPWHSIAPYLPYAGLLLVMTMPLALWNLNYSSQPEAMKVFAYVPFADHGALAKATVDALFARMMLPVLLLFGVLGVAGVGVRGLVSFLAVLTVAYAAAMVLGRGMLGKTLPFAAPFDPNRNASSGRIMGPALISMVVSGVLIFAGAHLNSWWFDLGLLVIAAPIAWLSRKRFDSIMIDLRQGA